MPVLAIEGDTTSGVEQGLVPAETTTDVADLGLDFTVETGAVHLGEPKIIRLLAVTAQTENQALTAAIITDGTVNTLTSTVNTAVGVKARVEIPVALTGTVVGVRLSKTALTKRIEVSRIELDVQDTGVVNPDTTMT